MVFGAKMDCRKHNFNCLTGFMFSSTETKTEAFLLSALERFCYLTEARMACAQNILKYFTISLIPNYVVFPPRLKKTIPTKHASSVEIRAFKLLKNFYL